MKAIPYFILIIFCCIKTYGQNLVPNASFELYNNCPNNVSQIAYCKEWYSYTSGTPDYFNACGANGYGVPSSHSRGSEYAANGNAFVGVFTFSNLPNDKEYVAVKIDSLEKGAAYEVSICVSLADNSSYATNDLGVYFFKNATTFVNTKLTLPVSPQISYQNYGPIVQKVGWVRLKGVFVADSTYDHLVIGGFNSPVIYNLSNLKNYCYYYIDSVVVKKAKRLTIHYSDSLLCVSDSISIPYSVGQNWDFDIANIFSLQLSDASGSFTNPTTIGTINSTSSGLIKGQIPTNIIAGNGYKTRLVSDNIPDTSDDNGKPIRIGLVKPPKPILTANIPVCTKDTLKVLVQNPPPNCDWQGYSPFGTIDTNAIIVPFPLKDYYSGLYVIRAVQDGCPSDFDTVKVDVFETISTALHVSATPSNIVSPGTTVVFSASTVNVGANSAYQWLKNGKAIVGATDSSYTGVMGQDFHKGDSICLSLTNSIVCSKPGTIVKCAGQIIDLGLETHLTETVKLHPNPNSGSFFFESNKNGSLFISSAEGVLVGQYLISKGKNKVELPFECKKGFYIVKFISTQNEVQLMKMTVQ